MRCSSSSRSAPECGWRYGARCRTDPVLPTANRLPEPMPNTAFSTCELPLTCGLQLVPFHLSSVPLSPTA